MKAKVRLTYSVEMFVEGKSEEAIEDWLRCITQTEAKELLGEKAEALNNIRLCDLNENTRKIYEDAVKEV